MGADMITAPVLEAAVDVLAKNMVRTSLFLIKPDCFFVVVFFYEYVATTEFHRNGTERNSFSFVKLQNGYVDEKRP